MVIGSDCLHVSMSSLLEIGSLTTIFFFFFSLSWRFMLIFFMVITFHLLPKGAYDDPNGSHISIEVVSSQFEGKRPVQRQQLVYKAIWQELQGPVHAVDSMVCKTPSEA